jgi:hypothetical protein
MELKEECSKMWNEFRCLGYGPVAYYCTHCNDPAGSVKDREPLECQDNCQLPRTIVKGCQVSTAELGSQTFA